MGSNVESTQTQIPGYDPRKVPSYQEFDSQVSTMLSDDPGAFIPVTNLKERFEFFYRFEWDWKKQFWKGKGNALEYFQKRPDKFTVVTQESINDQLTEWIETQKRKHVDHRVDCQVDYMRIYDYNPEDPVGLNTMPQSFEKQLGNVLQGQAQCHIRIFACLFEFLYSQDLDKVAQSKGYMHAEDMLINRIKAPEVEVKRDNKRGWFVKCTRPMPTFETHLRKLQQNSQAVDIENLDFEESPDVQDEEAFPSLGGGPPPQQPRSGPSTNVLGVEGAETLISYVTQNNQDGIAPNDSISNVGMSNNMPYKAPPRGPIPNPGGSQVSNQPQQNLKQPIRGPPPQSQWAGRVGGRSMGPKSMVTGPPPGVSAQRQRPMNNIRGPMPQGPRPQMVPQTANSIQSQQYIPQVSQNQQAQQPYQQQQQPQQLQQQQQQPQGMWQRPLSQETSSNQSSNPSAYQQLGGSTGGMRPMARGVAPPGFRGPPPQGVPGPAPQRMPGPTPQGVPGPRPQGIPGPAPQGIPGSQPMGIPGSQPQGTPGPVPQGIPGPPPSMMGGPARSVSSGQPMGNPRPGGPFRGPPPRGMRPMMGQGQPQQFQNPQQMGMNSQSKQNSELGGQQNPQMQQLNQNFENLNI